MMLLLGALLGAASAQDLGTCPQDGETWLEGEAYLRALSLDLRGVIPTADEYALLEDGELPEDVLADWLVSEEFAWEVVRQHRKLLFPNVTDIRLISNRQRLDTEGDVYYRYLVAPHYRGGPVFCGDFEASWDEDGELITSVDEDGYTQEGWVWVEPYWDPNNPIKMCAFGAQEALVSPLGTDCGSYDSRYDPYCGCGPNLAFCDTPELGHNGGNPEPPVAMGIAGDVEQRVAHMITEQWSYLELLTGRTAYMNGPLVHFYRYQTRLPAHIRFHQVPVHEEDLPDLDFVEDADTWVPVELGPEQGGVFTSTQYLMKFQTRRARTNRFYTAFLCQPFQPPDGGIEGLNEDTSLDLTTRPGCNYCHAVMEPAGAHWARWTEYGAGWLDPEVFPAHDPDCEWCATTGESCSQECDAYYVVEPISSEEDPYVGWLKSYEFLEERHYENAELGPAWLVQKTVEDGRLPDCVAQTTAEWLLGREVYDSEEAWVEELSAGFAASGFQYGELVRDIVTSDTYRRVE
jgi:hypothetical protein